MVVPRDNDRFDQGAIVQLQQQFGRPIAGCLGVHALCHTPLHARNTVTVLLMQLGQLRQCRRAQSLRPSGTRQEFVDTISIDVVVVVWFLLLLQRRIDTNAVKVPGQACASSTP